LKQEKYIVNSAMTVFSKVEIAVQLLLRAKELFKSGEYVPSTVLAGAGQQLLRDLCKARGVDSTIQTISEVSGHSEKKIHQLVVDTYNKMKHADVDPDDSVVISEQEPRVLMTLAAVDLMRLKEIKSQEISDFLEFIQKIKST
jgi:hypothetical protein